MTILYILAAILLVYLSVGAVMAFITHQPKMIVLWFVLLLGAGVQ